MECKPFSAGRPLERTQPPALTDADRKVLSQGGKIHFERVGDSVTKHIEQPNALNRQKADLMAIKKRWNI